MAASDKERKDRLIQTRVPKSLDDTLQDEARKRRVSVSHLIRSVLEDTFELVGDVMTGVDHIVADSVGFAGQVKRDAKRIARSARGKPEDNPDLSHVYAWNAVVLNTDATCSSCGTDLAKGTTGNAGLSDDPSKPRAWLCDSCLAQL